jgi:hypothetical protein
MHLDRDVTNRKATAELDMAPLLKESYSSRLQLEFSKKLRKRPAVLQSPAADGPKALCSNQNQGWAL